MEKHSLLDDESIAAWIADHEPGGTAKLLSALRKDEIGGARARHVRDWVARQAALSSAISATEEAALRHREVGAAERSARHARSAAIAAWIGGAVSLMALALSLWAAFK